MRKHARPTFAGDTPVVLVPVMARSQGLEIRFEFVGARRGIGIDNLVHTRRNRAGNINHLP